MTDRPTHRSGRAHEALAYDDAFAPFAHLANLHATHERISHADDPGDLFAAYRDCAQLLEDGGSAAEAEILSLDLLDLDKLIQRPRVLKPEVVITAEITSRANLSVRWMPLQRDDGRSTYRRPPNVDTPIGGRPDNELMFIHNVQWLARKPNKSADPVQHDPFWSEVRSDLIAAITGLFNRMLDRLDLIAEVYCLDKLEVVPTSERHHHQPDGDDRRARQLRVYDVETRDVERIAGDLAGVFSDEIALRDFHTAVSAQPGAKAASHTLKKQGYAGMTPARLSRLIWMHDEAATHGILPGPRLNCGDIHRAPLDRRSVRRVIAARPIDHEITWPGTHPP